MAERLAALEEQAKSQLGLKQPETAIAIATEALEIARSSNDKSREATFLLLIGPAHMQVGAHITALKVVKEAIRMFGDLGNKAKEAEAAIALARLHNDATKLGDMRAADAASQALQLAKQLGDKGLEASATLEMARAQLLQVKDATTAHRAVEEALAAFKALGDKRGEATASEVLAKVHLAKMDSEPAMSAAKEAHSIYTSLKDEQGIKSSSSTIESVKASQYAVVPAKLMVEDKTGVAIVEMSAGSSQDSLMMIIDTLKSMAVKGWHGLKAICLMVEGKEVPKQVVPPLLSTGTFSVGLKSVGLPIIGCTWGFVSGDTWHTALAMDYRVTSADTVFDLPVVGSPSVLAKLIGSQYVAELMMTQGQMLAQHVQEMGLFHAALGSPDEARKMCLEFARRVAGMPALACRETINLLNPDPVEFFTGKQELREE